MVYGFHRSTYNIIEFSNQKGFHVHQGRRCLLFNHAEAKITLSVVISLPPYDIVIGLHKINMYDLNYIVKAFIK